MRTMERSEGLNPTQRTTGSKGMLKGAEIVFSREEQTNWLSNTEWLALRTC